MRYLAQNVGPKERSREYNDSITRLMPFSKPRRVSKKTQRAISINTLNNGPTIKLVELYLNKFNIPALIDTGSTHSLISAESYQKIPRSFFTPVKLHMKVAGHVLKNDVIGRAHLPVEFKTKDKSTVRVMLEFLIAHALNGYDAIIGLVF